MITQSRLKEIVAEEVRLAEAASYEDPWASVTRRSLTDKWVNGEADDVAAALKKAGLQTSVERAAPGVDLRVVGTIPSLTDRVVASNRVLRNRAAEKLASLGWTGKRTNAGGLVSLTKEGWSLTISSDRKAVYVTFNPVMDAEYEASERKYAREKASAAESKALERELKRREREDKARWG